jgi:Tfp pilus assembly protein PilO
MSKQRTWILGAVAGIAVILIAAYTLGISPIVSQISAANAQTSTIVATNNASQAQLASLKVQYAGIGKLKTSLNTLRASIPETVGASGFFNELVALSAAFGVTVTNLTLADATVYAAPAATSATSTATTSTDSSTETPAPSTSTTTTPTATPTVAGAGLVIVPVTLSVSGPFESVRAFVGAVQTGSRLLFVSSVSISTGSDGSTGADITGDLFTLQGTSDVVTKQKLTPTATPTSTATPTPTPTPLTTTSSTKSKSSGSGGTSGGTSTTPVAPVAPSTPDPGTSTPADPGTPDPAST